MFNKEEFIKAFDAAIIQLAASEKITKAVLLDLSRTVLLAFQANQDIGYVNRLLTVLSPVNRKVAVLYFQAFTGFKYSAEKREFTSKDKKVFDDAFAALALFLEDPLNNIWTWAEREIEIEAKDFDEKRMKKACEALIKKVNDNKLSQLSMLEAMLEAGLSMDTLIALMGKIEGKAEA